MCDSSAVFSKGGLARKEYIGRLDYLTQDVFVNGPPRTSVPTVAFLVSIVGAIHESPEKIHTSGAFVNAPYNRSQ